MKRASMKRASIYLLELNVLLKFNSEIIIIQTWYIFKLSTDLKFIIFSHLNLLQNSPNI